MIEENGRNDNEADNSGAIDFGAPYVFRLYGYTV